MKNIHQKIIILYKNYWWLTPLTIFLLWRLVLELLGHLFLSITVPVENLWPADPSPPLWYRWDSGWYSSIVTEGYKLQTDSISNTVFFPLYPLIWKMWWAITGWPRLMTGLVVSNLAALAATLTFYRWVQTKYNQTTAKKTITLWLIFPTSFFLISPYSEGLFALLIALSLLLTEKKKWFASAVAACLAGATRPVGILLWPWLIYTWWREKKSSDNISSWLFIIPPLGLLTFSMYLWQVTGNPLAWLQGQTLAQRTLQMPLEMLANYLFILFSGGQYWLIHVGELAALTFAGWLFVRHCKQDMSQATLVLFLLVPSLFTGILTSFPRFIIVALPIFLALAKINNRPLIFAYYTIATSLLIIGIFNFVTWRWVA